MKFLFISHEGLTPDLAAQIKKEGHAVKMCILDKRERDMGDGFVEKVDDWEPHREWADVIVLDDSEFGSPPDRLRQSGKAVVGGTPHTDKLEMDRDFAQLEMKSVGMNILPCWDFESFDDAIKFLKENPQRVVIKPNGKAQNEKVLSYVGQEEDGRDALMMLEKYKKGWSARMKSFQLQKFASGVEVAVGAFFNGKEFVLPACVNFEHKRMFNDDIGPSTGEMGCYDEKTEVLTRSGWKRFARLTLQDEICTLNPTNMLIEYQVPSRIVKYSHHRRLLAIKNRSIDICVTPNHRMFVGSPQGARMRRYKFVRADQLERKSLIPRSGAWRGQERRIHSVRSVRRGHYEGTAVAWTRTEAVEVTMQDWVSFLGIWLAEGWCMPGGLAALAQKTPEKTRKIEELLSRLPFSFRKHKSSFVFHSQQLFAELSPLGNAYSKHVPQYIKDLPPVQIRAFLDGFGLGDGAVKRGGRRIFHTASRRLADDLQELLLKVGRVGLIKKRARRGRRGIVDHWANGRDGTYEVVERVHKLNSGLDRRDMHWVEYSGKVYCATVPNHVMYVRRNGKPYWCGNTSSFWDEDNRLIREALLPMAPKIQGYVGYFDVNCIATPRALYPLECTPRFGYPTINLQMEGVLSPWGEFLHAIASGRPYALRTKRGFQIAVVVAVPPFPFEDPAAFRKYSEDAAILFKKPIPEGLHPCDVKLVDGDWRLAGSTGYALVVTGSGSTMEDARREAYHRVKNILIPNMFYRTDIGERWTRDGDLLQSWGYLG